MGGFFSVPVCLCASENQPQCKGVICQTKFDISDDADVSSECGSVTVLERQSCWHFGTRTKHTARASQIFCGESSFRLTWFMIMIYTRFSADSRSSLTKNLAQPSPLLATCTFAIRTSRSLIEVLGNTKVGTYSHQLWQADFTQSEFELHPLSEVPGTPKMVLSHIKYGKAGCDREIRSRLGGIDRDITTLSAHALIGHCLGNSHMTCQKFTFSEMPALVESESSFGAYVSHRRPGGFTATSDLVGVCVWVCVIVVCKMRFLAQSQSRKKTSKFFTIFCMEFLHKQDHLLIQSAPAHRTRSLVNPICDSA